MAAILIVEDEISINELVKRNLQLVGHHCTSVFDGKTAISEIERHTYDLIILDIMLPEIDGFEVFKKVHETPTIFLTVRSSLSDRIKGFSMGADDYLTKPFEMLELLARVEAVLRRTQKNKSCFEAGAVRIDFDSRQVFYMGQLVECTPKEFELLEVLVKNRNIALSRERLLELVWGYDYEGDTRTIDVHIQKLRKKLGWENMIKTVYKLGYRLEVNQ
ncbi:MULTISPECIES: response regulator transcription factor [Paenibacillus]|uniref:Two-component system response regulator n=1 Tax=Paenibacillus naphthalenovorans TaxID=162209 RepID=A0A0U2MXJ8_9BACL|nr:MULTISPECIES: response regulator transcription factor [Paenibacillus]ALS22879.1 two-component system response regulator [Paenibacillus naphthalenovorans]NTZ17522.1 response regulator transcription factor [Paenibacillus sp. JMULE4]GCL72061.1 DNA-binding response regulator [Paenibacillus naphthalenovorans]SDJ70442.1 DNA-binding response regulator, OmpR family, contains REC and winged-helix (wHTH) domain [Paenibacillus naphthalenovorans]